MTITIINGGTTHVVAALGTSPGWRLTVSVAAGATAGLFRPGTSNVQNFLKVPGVIIGEIFELCQRIVFVDRLLRLLDDVHGWRNGPVFSPSRFIAGGHVASPCALLRTPYNQVSVCTVLHTPYSILRATLRHT